MVISGVTWRGVVFGSDGIAPALEAIAAACCAVVVDVKV
jgi:hypothetical protein